MGNLSHSFQLEKKNSKSHGKITNYFVYVDWAYIYMWSNSLARIIVLCTWGDNQMHMVK